MSVRRGRPIPAIVGLVFAALWGQAGAMALPTPWSMVAAIAAVLVSLALAVRLWRAPAVEGASRMFGRSAYLISVALELVAIYAASVLLPRLGLQGYFVEVVGVIVGLHFIGLWKATSLRRFLGIAAGMCVMSLAAMLLPLPARTVAVGFGNALVLWIGAGGSAQRARG